jgi:hypothetical protein
VDKPSAFTPKPEQLASLLGIGIRGEAEEGEAQDAQTMREWLRDGLASQLPLDTADEKSLPATLGRPCPELTALAGRLLGEVLLDSQTDLSVLKTIKEYGKTLSARAGKGPSRAGAVAIYYAAIASAVLFHHEKITEHSYRSLARSLEMLIEKPWMAPKLVGLFVEARKVCQPEME